MILRQLGNTFGPLSKIKAKGSASMIKFNNIRFAYTSFGPTDHRVGYTEFQRMLQRVHPSNVQGE